MASKRLGHGADLVQLDQNRIGDALLDAALEDRRVGDEDVVAHELDLVAQRVRQPLPAVPVVFRHAVFDRDDGGYWRTQSAQSSTICSEVRSLLSDFLKTYLPSS